MVRRDITSGDQVVRMHGKRRLTSQGLDCTLVNAPPWLVSSLACQTSVTYSSDSQSTARSNNNYANYHFSVTKPALTEPPTRNAQIDRLYTEQG